MTGLSDEAGVYILGVMHPLQAEVFCPLYVGKILKRSGGLGKNIIRHYHSDRDGFFKGNSLFDVNRNMTEVYSDIHTLYYPHPRKHGNKLAKILHISNNHNTLLWFNSPEFYNTIFKQPGLYSTNHNSEVNRERQSEMHLPNGGHWSSMIAKAQNSNNPALEASIRNTMHLYDKALACMKSNFAFTYASISPTEMNLMGTDLSIEEAITKIELDKYNLFTYSRARGLKSVKNYIPFVTVDLSALNLFQNNPTTGPNNNANHSIAIISQSKSTAEKSQGGSSDLVQQIIHQFSLKFDIWNPKRKPDSSEFHTPNIKLTEKDCNKNIAENWLDGVLGAYIYSSDSAQEGRIELHTKCLKWHAEKFEASDSNTSNMSRSRALRALTRVVLAHELGHWIHHYLDSLGCDSGYCKYFSGKPDESEIIKEAIAQYITKHALIKDEDAMALFEYILLNQDSIYRGHEILEKDGSMKTLDDMIVQLHRYRQFKEPMKTIDEFLKCTKIDPSDSIIRAQNLKGKYSM